MYQCGDRVEKNLEVSYGWYRKAAENDMTEAQREVGKFLCAGSGVDKDETEAFLWFSRAAKQKDLEAQREIGKMYHNGIGTEKDDVLAIEWFQKAAIQGDAEAQLELGNMYHYGYGVEADYEDAIQWYKKAAGQGNADAWYYLGEMYCDGNLVEKDINNAIRYYEIAKEQDKDRDLCHEQNKIRERELCSKIGEYYESISNYERRAVWYRKAAELGHKGAYASLKSGSRNMVKKTLIDKIKSGDKAAIDDFGYFVSKIEMPYKRNYDLEKAAELGSVDAQEWLKRIEEWEEDERMREESNKWWKRMFKRR